MAETPCILCTQEDESPERGSGKNFSCWLTPFLALHGSGFTPTPFQGRQVGVGAQYLGQQAIFCSFMQPACDKNAFIHPMCSVMAFSEQTLACGLLTR